MGDGSATRPLKTHIIRSGVSLRVLQNFDVGCSKDVVADAGPDAPPRCEWREYEAALPGMWVHHVSRRFGDGQIVHARRADQESPRSDQDMWGVAQFRVSAAWRISNWSLGYLEQALRSGELTDNTMNTGVGIANILPECTSNHRLSSITFFYPGHNLQVDIIRHSDVVRYESSLCRKPTPPPRYAAR